MKVRYKAIISYDGTSFYGWQKNNHGKSIQGEIENTLYQIFGLKEYIKVFCAGRTDAGVHSSGQVIHFDHEEKDLKLLLHSMNCILHRQNIHVKTLEVVSSDFHARFSAKYRVYKYVISTQWDYIRKNYSWVLSRNINLSLLKSNLASFVGSHDFKNFCASQGENKCTFRSLDSITITHYDNTIQIIFIAKSFLHHQIRFIVGAAVYSALKDLGPHHCMELLTASQRKPMVIAPSCGLDLLQVIY